MFGPTKFRLMSAFPFVRYSATATSEKSSYVTLVNPSALSNSLAMYCGAQHRLADRRSLIAFVSSGNGVLDDNAGRSPRNPAVPASVNPFRNFRRLQLPVR